MIHEPGDLLILSCPMTVIFGLIYKVQETAAPCVRLFDWQKIA